MIYDKRRLKLLQDSVHLQATTLRKYNLTPKQFEKMLRDQNGRCAICRICILGRDLKGRLKANIDHDHYTDKVRKLLCATCNTGLGAFKDNVRLLANAIVYLEDHEEGFSSREGRVE